MMRVCGVCVCVSASSVRFGEGLRLEKFSTKYGTTFGFSWSFASVNPLEPGIVQKLNPRKIGVVLELGSATQSSKEPGIRRIRHTFFLS